ncbi:MAG: substrate-binding domain-containing protein, partial [Anaerolineae bacterium]|nr:substrate-binding domain-containing protein [Anaerolineae bacterium]
EYELIITNTGAIAEREINAIRLLLSRRVEGIILASTQTREALDLIRQVVEKEKIPLVSVDNRLPDLNVDVVSVNSFEGAYTLTRHLLSVGYQRIAIITGPQTESHARDRLSGYKTALEEARIAPDETLIGAGNWESESGYALTAHWLSSGDPPEAIFACNNFMGMGALSAMRDASVAVPEDIALVSFDDVEFGYLLHPALTTLKYSWQAVGEKAIELLLRRLDGQEKDAPPQHIDIPFELMIRDSCGAQRRGSG